MTPETPLVSLGSLVPEESPEPQTPLGHPGTAVMMKNLVGKGGFEPPASASRTQRANQTAPLPESSNPNGADRALFLSRR
jgi:hypothetical protein